jgi:hypothetical protein
MTSVRVFEIQDCESSADTAEDSCCSVTTFVEIELSTMINRKITFKNQ